MERPAWYLLAYDIADPRRLQRIHRLIKKKGVAAQNSVFFVDGTESAVNEFMDEIADLMAEKEDDLRAYPISSPGNVWTFGVNPLAETPLVQMNGEVESGRKRIWIHKLKRALGRKS